MLGVLVLRRVGRGRKFKNADAIVLDLIMAEGRARELVSNPKRAIPGIVQVWIFEKATMSHPHSDLMFPSLIKVAVLLT